MMSGRPPPTQLSFRFETVPLDGAPGPPKKINIRRPKDSAFERDPESYDTSEELAEAEHYEPTLAVHFLVAINLGLRGTKCGHVLDTSTRILYACGLLAACTFGVLFIIKRDLLNFQWMNWFGYVVWAVFVLVELLLFLGRSFARWTHWNTRYDKTVHDEDSCTRMLRMIIQRDSFDNGLQFLIMFALQLVASGLSTLGILVLIANMQRDSDQEHWGHDNLDAMWSTLFAFVSFTYCMAGLTDAIRVREIDAERGWWAALEFTSWRVALLVLLVPILTIFFLLYTHTCCAGPWTFRYWR
jgi:hypothetical protein